MTQTTEGPSPRGVLPSFAERCQRLEAFLGDVLDADASLPDPCRAFVRGGKRLRGRLLLACATPSDGEVVVSALLRAAAAVECFHAASLMHDDIVDGSDTRRGVPVIHRALGARGASLAGWHLGQTALGLMAPLPPYARERFAEVGQAMSRGQLTEIVRAGDLTMLPEDRLAIMQQKTAAVFGLTCELGGVLTGQDASWCARLRRFGEAFGMVFQVADDVDDLFASRAELGREPGADLAAGVMSLLDAYALQSAAPGEPDGIDTVGGRRTSFRGNGALGAAHAAAEGYAESARGHLHVLPADEGTIWTGALLASTLARVRRHVDATH